MPDLAESLKASAQNFLQRALRAYAENDDEVILPFAAIGLEHASKAYLAHLHPVLLAERGKHDAAQFENLLHLLDSPHRAQTTRVRTIGAHEALRRLRQVLPGARPAAEEAVHAVFDARSGVLHLGQTDHRELREGLSTALRVAGAVFDALDVPSSDRWGQYEELAATVIDESIEAARQETARLIAGARTTYMQLVEAHPTPEALRATVDVLEQRWMSSFYDAGMRGGWTCPACGHEGQVAGTVEHASDEPIQYEDYDRPALWAQRLVVEFFACPVCRLRVHGRDHIAAAGIETESDWEPTREPPPSVSDWEPDEDWLRGR